MGHRFILHYPIIGNASYLLLPVCQYFTRRERESIGIRWLIHKKNNNSNKNRQKPCQPTTPRLLLLDFCLPCSAFPPKAPDHRPSAFAHLPLPHPSASPAEFPPVIQIHALPPASSADPEEKKVSPVKGSSQPLLRADRACIARRNPGGPRAKKKSAPNSKADIRR